MDDPPDRISETRLQCAGDRKRDDKLSRDHPESKPQRTVARGERDHGVSQAQVRKRVENRGCDVQLEEYERLAVIQRREARG